MYKHVHGIDMFLKRGHECTKSVHSFWSMH